MEKDTVNVNPGDVITVSFTLKRTDAEEAYTMYAMQDEIAYDSNFFELVDGSALVTNGIETRDLAMRDNMRKFYMNYVSMSGGDSWQPQHFDWNLSVESHWNGRKLHDF